MLTHHAWPGTTYQAARAEPQAASGIFSVRVSLAGIEPVGSRCDMGFRVQVKSDLRNHHAIVQPRLYDSDCVMVTMVTQITLIRFDVRSASGPGLGPAAGRECPDGARRHSVSGPPGLRFSPRRRRGHAVLVRSSRPAALSLSMHRHGEPLPTPAYWP